MKTAVVGASDLGNCWLPARFVEDSRCRLVLHCRHPEKDTCNAVAAEHEHIEEYRDQRHAEVDRLASERHTGANRRATTA